MDLLDLDSLFSDSAPGKGAGDGVKSPMANDLINHAHAVESP